MPFQKGNTLSKGKQKKTLAKELAFELFIKMVEKEKEPIFNAVINSAKQGNIQALKEIFDRWFGKVKENMDITTLGDKIEGIIVLPKK